MITKLYFQGQSDSEWTLDQVFEYKVRYQILADSEDQFDYLTALQYMYGREIQIDTWAGWHEDAAAYLATRRIKKVMLPVWFSTTPLTVADI